VASAPQDEAKLGRRAQCFLPVGGDFVFFCEICLTVCEICRSYFVLPRIETISRAQPGAQRSHL